MQQNQGNRSDDNNEGVDRTRLISHLTPQYVLLSEAATRAGRSQNELLQMGIQGSIFIFAPVLNFALYEWTPAIAEDIFSFPTEPIRRAFDVNDYVILETDALAEIAARGGAIVRSFSAPQIASETYHAVWRSRHDRGLIAGIDTSKLTDKEFIEFTQSFTQSIATDNAMLEAVFPEPWMLVDDQGDKARAMATEMAVTTIEQLYLSSRTLDALLAQPHLNKVTDAAPVDKPTPSKEGRRGKRAAIESDIRKAQEIASKTHRDPFSAKAITDIFEEMISNKEADEITEVVRRDGIRYTKDGADGLYAFRNLREFLAQGKKKAQ